MSTEPIVQDETNLDAWDWEPWAMEKSVNYFKDRATVAHTSYSALTDKVNNILKYAALIISLTFTTLTFLFDNPNVSSTDQFGLIKGLIMLAFLFLISSVILAAWLSIPQKFTYVEINDKLESDLTFATDKETAYNLIGCHLTVIETNDDRIAKFGFRVMIGWILLSIAVVLISITGMVILGSY